MTRQGETIIKAIQYAVFGMAGEPLDVFISYSHKDETLKNELLPHLKMLQREGRIKTWQDRDIEAGTEWATAIKEQLEKAKIILLMVTTNFLASDYCYETEMQRAVQRHKERTARVIPIVLKPCGWKYSEFKVLQVLPKDGKPISRWQDPADAWFDVEEGIRKVIDRLHEEQRQREEEAEELIAIEQQQQDLEAEQREWEQKQQVEIERLQQEQGELAKSQAEWARQEQARQQLEAEQREWERQRQAETDRLQRERAELEKLKAEWQQREQERRQQVTEIKTSEPKGISTKSAGLPKLQTIQFQTPTLSSESGGLFGLGEKKWTTSNQSKQATQFLEDLGSDIALHMVKIPKGQFWMGSPDGEGHSDERPQHSVEVSEFWMGQYAVTQAQWTQIAAYPKVEIDLEPFPARFKGDNRPVERVNWDQAVEFCQRLLRRTDRTYRLPSEAEWEYACRAGTTTPFYFGPTLTPDLANYNGNYTYGDGPKGIYREQTVDVGSFPPNAFGLYDMHGNVWEWCQDIWHGNYEGAPADGSVWMAGGDQARQILRGGSWVTYPVYCRSASRGWDAPVNTNDFVGFRVVCGGA